MRKERPPAPVECCDCEKRASHKVVAQGWLAGHFCWSHALRMGGKLRRERYLVDILRVAP